MVVYRVRQVVALSRLLKKEKNPSLKMWSHKPGGRIPRGRLSRFYCICNIHEIIWMIYRDTGDIELLIEETE